jgi:hypothetical protein
MCVYWILDWWDLGVAGEREKRRGRIDNRPVHDKHSELKQSSCIHIVHSPYYMIDMGKIDWVHKWSAT